MANIKQQKKRNLTNEKKRLLNASYKSSVKSAVKAVETAVAVKDLEAALKAYDVASMKLDKGVTKGVFHKNFVARNKSRLSLLVNSLKEAK